MKTKLRAKLLSILAILTLGLGWVSLANVNNVYAEDAPATSLFVGPMSQKIILIPGETYSGSINISNSNNSTENLKYIAEIGPYNRIEIESNKDSYGVADVSEINERNTIMQWITLEKTTGTIAPNDTDVLNFTIKVPKDAPAGAQYASILVYKDDSQKDDTHSSNGANISSKFQVVSALIANVAGETVEKASISENDMPSMLTTNKLEATSMVRNDGNIYTDASYTLQVWPMGSDEEICTNEENPETSTVLPGTERYHTQTCNLPAVGIFKAKQTVKIFDEVSILEKTIFVCPIWLMVVVFLLVIGIIVGITLYIKKRHSAKDDD